MRGKVIVDLVLTKGHRITPAYAGKSAGTPPPDQHKKDHPRVCGEKINSIPPFKEPSGSPPHVRGKVVRRSTERRVDGITPAYAGKSQLPFSGSLSLRGSPPRARGKVLHDELHAAKLGITPAYAGKRRTGILPSQSCRDHPRICGEKTSPARSSWPPPGSSPRVRGKAYSFQTCIGGAGITPAYAGKRNSISSPICAS